MIVVSADSSQTSEMCGRVVLADRRLSVDRGPRYAGRCCAAGTASARGIAEIAGELLALQARSCRPPSDDQLAALLRPRSRVAPAQLAPASGAAWSRKSRAQAMTLAPRTGL
jgi:hypothetical protein